MNGKTLAPHLRRWAREHRQEMASRYFRHAYERHNGAAWVLALLLACGAIAWAIDRDARMKEALAHIPAADVRQLSGDDSVTPRGWQADQQAAIAREWRKIEGKR